MKPLNGGQGQGIFKLTEQEMETMQYSEYRNYICEELICQNHIMDELHKKSVNTVRVLTFRGEIVACALRIGGGDSVVDNLHSNGVCAHLDIDTGIVDAPCIDNHLRKYLYHPDSHKLLIGFEVPNWNICCECVREAAKVVPQVQYVGWDVAILENDVAIIEGNHDPGHDVVQMIAQTGLYDRIREKS
jgi:glutathione synthase/RimK-type ligase-like ATP-grasp enzyme